MAEIVSAPMALNRGAIKNAKIKNPTDAVIMFRLDPIPCLKELAAVPTAPPSPENSDARPIPTMMAPEDLPATI